MAATLANITYHHRPANVTFEWNGAPDFEVHIREGHDGPRFKSVRFSEPERAALEFVGTRTLADLVALFELLCLARVPNLPSNGPRAQALDALMKAHTDAVDVALYATGDEAAALMAAAKDVIDTHDE